MITCPNTACGVELEYVNAYSQCRQKVSLDAENRVINYSSIEEVYETASFNCPDCGEDLTELVKV